MAFNETFLRTRDKMFLTGYQPMARADRLNRHGVGVAILVRNGINFDVVNPIPTSGETSYEQLTITIQTTTGTLHISTLYCPKGRPSREIIEGFCLGWDNVILTGDFNLLQETIVDMTLTLTNDTPTHTCDSTNDKDILDLMFISPPIIPHFMDFWVRVDLGSDHSTIIGVFSHTPLIDELPPQTVMLYHKADWKDINQTITNTMTNHTHDIHTSTIQDIDNYVNTLTDTITQTIDERVQSLKPNSVGIPQAIRDLIKEKRRQRRYWQQTRQQHYKTNYNRLDRTIKQYTRQTRQNYWTKYCNDMELSEGHTDAWRKLRSVINPRKRFVYPTLTTTDEHNNVTKHTTTEQKLDAFADQLRHLQATETQQTTTTTGNRQ